MFSIVSYMEDASPCPHINVPEGKAAETQRTRHEVLGVNAPARNTDAGRKELEIRPVQIGLIKEPGPVTLGGPHELVSSKGEPDSTSRDDRMWVDEDVEPDLGVYGKC